MISYTINQVAERLAVNHKTVRKAIANGTLIAFRVGRNWRVTEDALADYVASQTRKPPAVRKAIPQTARRLKYL